MAHAINTGASSFNFIARIGGWIHDAKASLALNAKFKRTYNELNKLDKRELDDIGFCRCDIANISRLHVYGR